MNSNYNKKEMKTQRKRGRQIRKRLIDKNVGIVKNKKKRRKTIYREKENSSTLKERKKK